MLEVIIGAGLLFDFLNGFHDSSNIVATVISSRAMSPRVALIMAAIAHFCAPFLFGVAVATTIGKGVIDPSAISPKVIIAGVIAAVLWNILTWWLGMPSSSSHALIGGLLGAAILAQGLEIIQVSGLLKVLLALFISPPLGMLAGYLFMRIVLFLVRKASPRVSTVFKRLQIFTALALSLSHGTNDAQKTMGILTMGLVSAGFQKTFEVPLWVIAASASAIALGTALGGWRLIHTLGGRIVRIRPIHGFTSQMASAGVILSAALLGGPVSTTQVVGSAIMGVGAAERISKVRWQVGREMIVTWLITIPVTAILSAALFMVLRVFIP
ncbi:MAG: inorganic phosphate transporter [Anaerolineaceae bacterium]|nr:MAG: inorganic phosphate transporter [Anaerolineaceae bacterium]